MTGIAYSAVFLEGRGVLHVWTSPDFKKKNKGPILNLTFIL
jgi:hypothetical protein